MVEADVAIVSDFRFPGGTSSAIAAETRSLVSAGYRVVLLPYATDFLRWTRSFHQAISALSTEPGITLVAPGTPVRCRLMCLHHPKCFEHIAADPFLVDAEQAVLIVHHPPVNGSGEPQYDVARIAAVLSGLVPADVEWAPVGPKVREGFREVAAPSTLTPEDWVNVLGPDQAYRPRPGPLGAVPAVGRHSRPDAIKWPENAEDMLAAYPEASDIRVRLMGFDPAAFEWFGRLPRNWEILRFGHMPAEAFLGTIDYFSYFHSNRWIEAFGRSILEAMAAGVVCFLPKDFEPTFGEGARYCTPKDVAAQVRVMHEDPEDYARQSDRAVALARDRYGSEVAVRRVRERIGDPRGMDAPAVNQSSRPRILYLASNGVGMGHQTRALALARRHKDRAEPIIVSMSRAFGVVRQEGILAEFIPFFRSSGMEQRRWHALIRAELSEMFRFYKPGVVALDSNVPYEGLLHALDAFPGIRRVWVRRAMWPPGVGEHFLKRGDAFDAILEPGEIAEHFDRGLTRDHRRKRRAVAPISYLREGEMLPRETARTVLGLDQERPAVFLQLGAGNNIRLTAMRDRILEKLATDVEGPTPQIVVGQWRMGRAASGLPSDVTVLGTFPFARFLKAFDFAVAMAGYNTFHENLRAGLPTLFLSNEHPEQDEQWARADYARVHGLGLAARAGNDFDVLRGVYQLSRADVRERLRAACARLPTANGADEAAAFLADLAYCSKPHIAARGDG